VARYRIVPARSHVSIAARSNVHPIHSEVSGLTGWLDLGFKAKTLDPDHAPSGHLEFPVEQLRSGNPLEEREMRRRVDARRYPTISGDLRMMKPEDDQGNYVVRGDLTFRGVTRTYEDVMTLRVLDKRTVELEGESMFDVRDFGMDPPRILMLKVYPEVTVRVKIVAEKEN
jgi:polyisoprenoid-binding protein YceI